MASELSARIGARIREFRQERGWNQRELADKIDDPAVLNQHISNWERGVYRPSDRYMGKIAAALGVDVAQLIAPDAPSNGTPDLMGALAVEQPTVAAQLDRIEDAIETLLLLVTRLLGDQAERALHEAAEEQARRAQRRRAA